MAGEKDVIYANGLLALIFNGVSLPFLADNAAASPAASFYLSLHTADPGPTGAQNTSEVTYTGYARVSVPRSPTGFLVVGNTCSLRFSIFFPAPTGADGQEATYFALGLSPSGPGTKLYSGPILPSITCTIAENPQLTIGTKIIES